MNEILEARDGSIWIASCDGVEIHAPDGTVERLTQILERSIRDTTGVAQDQEGDVWLTSGWGYEGAFRFDGARWSYYGPEQDLPGCRHKVSTAYR